MELKPSLHNAAGTQLFPRSENYLEPKMKTPRQAGAFEVLIDEGPMTPSD